MGNTVSGTYMFKSRDPKGPFRPDVEAYRLLGNKDQLATHFSRFYRRGDELLVNHHSYDRSGRIWLAPLKRAVVDKEGHMRLGYWQGNEAVKGKEIGIDAAACDTFYKGSGGCEARWGAASGSLEVAVPGAEGVMLLANKFDLERGVVVEGVMELRSEDEAAAIGVYVEEDGDKGTAVLLCRGGRAELGTWGHGQSEGFVLEDPVSVGVKLGGEQRFRLMVRRTMLELYVDDLLVQCYMVGEKTTGRIGLFCRRGKAVFQGLRAWEMNLDESAGK